MAKAFKWLLPGAVKKTTTKKNNKTKQNIRKETKKYSSAVIFNHFFFFFSLIHNTSMHVTAGFSQLTGNSLIPALPHISLVMRNIV